MKSSKTTTKLRRQNRIRSRVTGTAARPRLSVSKTNTSLFLQVINDEKGVTLASAHSREIKAKGNKVATAAALGKLLAEKAQAAKVTSVVFDRGGNLYTGRVKAAADGAREGGLQF